MKNIRIEIEEKRQRDFEVFSAIRRITEAAEEQVIATRTNREEYLRMMLEVAGELLNSAWNNCRPEWQECDCGLDGCGEWQPSTEAEKRIRDELFIPINRILYHSQELVEAVAREEAWQKD